MSKRVSKLVPERYEDEQGVYWAVPSILKSMRNISAGMSPSNVEEVWVLEMKQKDPFRFQRELRQAEKEQEQLEAELRKQEVEVQQVSEQLTPDELMGEWDEVQRVLRAQRPGREQVLAGVVTGKGSHI